VNFELMQCSSEQLVNCEVIVEYWNRGVQSD
jgi:hypothetical protein